jgi:hypothetical protein
MFGNGERKNLRNFALNCRGLSSIKCDIGEMIRRQQNELQALRQRESKGDSMGGGVTGRIAPTIPALQPAGDTYIL